MKLDLTDKIAVVSGSTSGIGLGIADGLAQAGATVVVVGRQETSVATAIASIKAKIQPRCCVVWWLTLAPNRVLPH